MISLLVKRTMLSKVFVCTSVCLQRSHFLNDNNNLILNSKGLSNLERREIASRFIRHVLVANIGRFDLLMF